MVSLQLLDKLVNESAHGRPLANPFARCGCYRHTEALNKFLELILQDIPPEEHRLSGMKEVTVRYRGVEGIDQLACHRHDGNVEPSSDIMGGIPVGCSRPGVDGLIPH